MRLSLGLNGVLPSSLSPHSSAPCVHQTRTHALIGNLIHLVNLFHQVKRSCPQRPWSLPLARIHSNCSIFAGSSSWATVSDARSIRNLFLLPDSDFLSCSMHPTYIALGSSFQRAKWLSSNIRLCFTDANDKSSSKSDSNVSSSPFNITVSSRLFDMSLHMAAIKLSS